MKKVCNNAYEQYCRSRPAASVDSSKRVKTLPLNSAGIHPLFRSAMNEVTDMSREILLDKMKGYRPQGVSCY